MDLDLIGLQVNHSLNNFLDIVFSIKLPMFRKELDNIKHQHHMSLPIIIEKVCSLYFKLFKVTPECINTGWCHEFAESVMHVAPKSLGDQLSIEWWLSTDISGNHAFILYKGRYYDAERPCGVDDKTQLPWAKRNMSHDEVH